MRSLQRPDPAYAYDPDRTIAALRAHRDRVPDRPEDDRRIPDPAPGHVLVATWNVANLGQHERRVDDLRLIAELLSWYEIIAVQEVADNRADFDRVVELMGVRFATLFNDTAGNNERSAFIYDTRRVALGRQVGEVAIVDSDRRWVRLPGIHRAFTGFNRNPFIASFRVESTNLLLANCHLIFGRSGSAAEIAESLELRQLEAYAIARWCDLRRNDRDAYTRHILAMGDFNLPRAEPGDPLYDALTRRGLALPPHESRIPTNVSRDSDYDQVAIVPHLHDHIAARGVFDFDAVVFPDIYDEDRPAYWRTCTKYYLSDHRPVWMQLRLPTD